MWRCSWWRATPPSPSPALSLCRHPPVGVTEPRSRVLGDVHLPDGFTVRRETWVFDPDTDTTVNVSANVIVEGTLVMRPASGIEHA